MGCSTIPTSWLRCPYSGKDLVFSGDTLFSDEQIYRKFGTYWDFFPETDLEFLNQNIWKTWQKLQNNGEVSYNEDPSGNLGVGPLKEYINFAKFCNYRGFVLDIGVGPQKNPSHFEGFKKKNVTFVGVDPLVGSQPRDFIFFRAIGEHLPFKDSIFDQILFTTSLDHFLDPVVALIEAKRILKDTGDILVLMGDKVKDVSGSTIVKTNEWYEKLKIPNGADDRFHFKKFGVEEFEYLIKKAGLKIVEKVRKPVRDWADKINDKVKASDPVWGDSLSYRIQKS